MTTTEQTTAPVTVRLLHGERELVRQYAAADRRSASDWIRGLVIDEIRRRT